MISDSAQAYPRSMASPRSFATRKTGDSASSHVSPTLGSAIRPGSEREARQGRRFVFASLLATALVVAWIWLSGGARHDGWARDLVTEAVALKKGLRGGQSFVRPGPALARRIDDAMRDFELSMSSQSRSVAEAEAAYKKRYHRSPPPGFDGWVKMALENNSTIIDNFDQLEADMAPFRLSGLRGSKLRRAMAEAKLSAPGEMLGSVVIRKGRAVVLGAHNGPLARDTLQAILDPIAPHLPDLGILFNWYAEPRILAGGSRSSLRGGARSGSTAASASAAAEFPPSAASMPPGSSAHFAPEPTEGNLTWSTLRSGCGNRALTSPKPLAPGAIEADVCAPRAAESLQGKHGFFVAPDTFWPGRTLVPMLSRAKIGSFQDIAAPNPCYSHHAYRHFEMVDKIPYEKKRPVVYWRGTATGMRMSPDNWVLGHRHRFVQYMAVLRAVSERAILGVSKTGNGRKGSLEKNQGLGDEAGERQPEDLLMDGDAARRALERLDPETFDVRFTSLQALKDESVYGALERQYPLAPIDHPTALHANKLVADLDGQSMSCRFYQLLDSQSVVLKQTIWTEWHSDRILPYVHYLPISLELAELPSLIDWLFHDPEGQRVAKRISVVGREWSHKLLRPIDISLYYYRLLLEYTVLHNAKD